MTRTKTPEKNPVPNISNPAASPGEVVAGVDTHRDEHVVAVLDHLGRLLDTARFAADGNGYEALLCWLSTLGTPIGIGIEGTGSYGHGLARYLSVHAPAGVEVYEIDRPDRSSRRRHGKSDSLDAHAAAQATLSQALDRAGDRQRLGVPKGRDGAIEALRNLRVARSSAVKQSADVIRQIKSLIITAPDELRAELRGLKSPALISRCARLRPDPARIAEPSQAVKHALRALARRHQHLAAEIDDADALIAPLVAQINPDLLAVKGVGPDVAGQLLVTVGQNPDRIHTEAAFARLCGVAPIPASSGKTHRMRLHRGGDRQANAALYRLVLSRMRWDPRTRAYIERRTTSDGLTKREAIRCLKRYAARELYPVLMNQTALDNP